MRRACAGMGDSGPACMCTHLLRSRGAWGLGLVSLRGEEVLGETRTYDEGCAVLVLRCGKRGLFLGAR